MSLVNLCNNKLGIRKVIQRLDHLLKNTLAFFIFFFQSYHLFTLIQHYSSTNQHTKHASIISRSSVHSSFKKFPEFAGVIYRNSWYMSSSLKVAMSKEMYINTLHRLRDSFRTKRPEKWRTNSWFLFDNAPAHRSVLVKDFLAKINVITLKHPPHSPDLAPANLYLFPRLKSTLKRQHFCDATEVIKNAREDWKAFTKWLPRMFPTPLQSPVEVYTSTRRCFEGNVA